MPPVQAVPGTLHLNTERGFRGGEIQALGLVDRLQATDRPALLLAQPGSPLLEKALQKGLHAEPWLSRGELDLAAAFRLSRIYKRRSPKIVHAHTAHALTLAILARGRSHLPAVVASRRVSFPLRSRFSRIKYRRADAVVAVSREIADSLLKSGLDPERVHVIHSGVDLTRFSSLPDRVSVMKSLGIENRFPVVGAVGALVPHKGHGILIDALAKVQAASPAAAAVIVGDGPLRSDLENAAAGLSIPVIFTGSVPDPASIFPALDVLALPSVSGEGSPAVIKEAAAAGVPVAAADVGGTAEILRHGREALLVPPGDPEALARALILLSSDPALARRLSESARDRVKAFSLGTMAEATWSLYIDLLKKI
ncbi:MAG: glycosyltransferase [Acidobacteriota bacterium]|jgi:glycosyltransferase involved in cell wall biosynthesis